MDLLPVLDLVGAAARRLAPCLAVVVEEGVGQDAVEPGSEVGALLELVEVRVRPTQGDRSGKAGTAETTWPNSSSPCCS
ncbi:MULTISPECIES: hypothetical protein [Streptomyces]|uniref:hypothetical protein n=1 Tax=Streptomyces TaxID=1883 RepID=UPI002E2CF775|nr:hypothetical protein [Streptomyces sp. NBC_00271]